MKTIKISMAALLLAGTAWLLLAGDHLDAPSVTGTTSDLASFYAFESPDNPANMVLVATMQGFLPPGAATENAGFDPDVLVEFNIDNTGNLEEDLVLQAIRKGDSLYFFGPAAPAVTGTTAEVLTEAPMNIVTLSPATSDAQAIVYENSEGMKFFAGPRDDPFFFDQNRYHAIQNGEAPGGFNNPGNDTFAERNVLAIVVELPKTMLGNGATGQNPLHPDAPMLNMWVTTKRR